jgi:hypothetical protein
MCKFEMTTICLKFQVFANLNHLSGDRQRCGAVKNFRSLPFPPVRASPITASSKTMPFLPQRLARLSPSLLLRRRFATASLREDTRQNLTEKIVQRYAVDLPPGKLVRSGDYVSIRPPHCMSHDNCKCPLTVVNRSMARGNEVYGHRGKDNCR